MTYEYEVVGTGQVIEVQQSIKEDAHTVLEVDGELVSVRRLISSKSGGFRLVPGASGGWSDSGYSKRPHQRQAEAALGRSLIKPGGDR